MIIYEIHEWLRFDELGKNRHYLTRPLSAGRRDAADLNYRVPDVRKLDSAFRRPDCSLFGNLAHAISVTGRDLA